MENLKIRRKDMKDDFRLFLTALWLELRLPQPTPIQLDIAEQLQHGADRMIIEAFRGIGKSWITAAFVLWLLDNDRQCRVMVVSANAERAAAFSTFCLQLIRDVSWLNYLYPEKDQKSSSLAFEVAGASPDQAPSVRSKGITGQMTGGRADVIIADDVEIPKNSETEGKRQKLREQVKEFDAILKPGGRVVYLGTPQCEESLYNELPGRGYEMVIWPVRYPDDQRQAYYGSRLGPCIRRSLSENHKLVGKSTEPSRFPESDLKARELSYGRSGFDLQFMLDTRLSDLHKYPLKLSDLLVISCNLEEAPEKMTWSASKDTRVEDLPTMGLSGDYFHRPVSTADKWVSYSSKILVVDPSGRGKDEMAWGVFGFCNGYIHLLEVHGSLAGYSDESLIGICETAKRHKVHKILTESNFGDGMFNRLLQPHLKKIYPCTIEEVRHSKQKELRMIDTLEPVMTQHRLVVDRRVIEQDYRVTSAREGDTSLSYSLFHQMTRLTRERGCLAHDDRLDMLSMGVTYFTQLMQLDADDEVKKREQEEWDRAVQKLMESVGLGGMSKEDRMISMR